MIKTLGLEKKYIPTFVNSNSNNNNKNKIIDPEILQQLIDSKNKINKDRYKKYWDKTKKFSNIYELVYIPNKNNRKHSISYYKPLSRSYFKLCEIITDFDLLSSKKNLNVLCLAEGPGGFMESVVNFRNNSNDNIYGITLKSFNKDIPGWKKAKQFITSNNIQITYGVDGTGNLYNIDNIKYLKSFIKGELDFITADGGFDFSIDFNSQEELSYRIIFSEIVSALYLLKKGGDFVCKLFDIHSLITVKFIFILTNHFDNVFITKPFTSRSANSEKYLVCKGFTGIDSNYIELLFLYIQNWDVMKNSLLSFIDVPEHFIRRLYIYNNITTLHQIKNINYTLDLIDNNIQNKKEIIEYQTSKAIDWCNRYNVRINNKSKFMNLNVDKYIWNYQ